MRFKKVVLAGGSGFIGHVLTEHFRDIAEEIIVISRHVTESKGNIKFIHWDGKQQGDWTTALENADIVVNLAGKSVNCRYTEKNRREIIESRVNSTMAIGKAISSCSKPPLLWIQCASATIYRHAEDRPMDEERGEIGSGFSVDVCKSWEQSFWDQDTPRTRKVLLRIAIVFGKEGGVFPRLKNLVHCGLGGRQGKGNQMVSWIHEKDLSRIIHWLADHQEASGTYNCSAPYPICNKSLMKILRKKMKVFVGFPAPAWLLKFGAMIIGTETELILKSRWVIPGKLLSEGFEFHHPHFGETVKDLLGGG